MHGCHQLKDECQISAERLEVPKKNSSSSFSFRRIKLKSESSPKCCSTGGYLKLFRKIVAVVTASVFVVMGLMRSVGTLNMLKFYAGIQLFLAYLTPKLMVVKRSLIPAIDNITTAPRNFPKIIEIIPAPLHLILVLGNLDAAEKILMNDASAQVIIPRNQHKMTFNASLADRIQTETDSSSIFESLAFALCESYIKNKRYPTKITVTGKSKISSCVLGRCQKALKLPRNMVSFLATNSSSSQNHLSECPRNGNDYFDCRSPSRGNARHRYSELCPDLAPLLQACGNRMTLERALAYKPPWAHKPK